MSFFRELLDPTKALSFGRFMALWMTAFCIGWDCSYIVYAWRINHELIMWQMAHQTPLGIALLELLPSPGTLLAQGGFCSLFYGVTKIGDITGTKVNGNGGGQ